MSHSVHEGQSRTTELYRAHAVCQRRDSRHPLAPTLRAWSDAPVCNEGSSATDCHETASKRRLPAGERFREGQREAYEMPNSFGTSKPSQVEWLGETCFVLADGFISHLRQQIC
jgi:hypothetical protein